LNDGTTATLAAGKIRWTFGLLIGAAVFLLAIAIAPFLLGFFAKGSPKAACQSNLKQEALAVLMYQADSDDYLPNASTWADQTSPYSRSKEIYTCPIAKPSAGEYGHAFLRSLSRRKGSEIPKPDLQPAIFDSTDMSWNANGSLDLLPVQGRHPGHTNCIAMLDSHVRVVDHRQLSDLLKSAQFGGK